MYSEIKSKTMEALQIILNIFTFWFIPRSPTNICGTWELGSSSVFIAINATRLARNSNAKYTSQLAARSFLIDALM